MRFEGLLDVQLSWSAGIIDAVPIEHAIRGVAILLNFDEQIARSYSVEASGRKEHRVAAFYPQRMDVLGDRACAQRGFELRAVHPLL